MEEYRKITNSVVLVTGGAGFIGSNLCEILLQQNNVVRCLDNFSTGYRHNLNDFIDHPDFTLIEGDICNIQDCKKAVKGVDFVLHQAALGSVPRSIKNPIKTIDVNIGGFVKMLFASVEAGVKRFVYAASSSTYGDRTDLPKIEHQIGKALSPYGITKYVDELFAANFSELYGIETIGLRYFNVFGRRQDPNGVYAAVIPKFIQSFIRHESPVINGDGSFSRDFTYIDNVIQMNQLAALTPIELIQKRIQEYYVSQDLSSEISSPHFLSQVFNVAHGEQTNLNELTEILRNSLSSYDSEIKNISVQYASERKGDIPHSKASVRKAQMILKYEPEYSVIEGLQEAMKWYWTNRKMNNKPINQEQDFFAHETAVIDTACEIGEGTKIWHFSHIMSHCKIGKNCNIGQNVVVSPKVQLGQNVKIQNNVSIYTGVSCEDDVFLGPSMVFTNIINPRSAINRKDQYDRTIVRKGASIGANATIICGVEIGKYALIGAGAVVTKNISNYALVVGNPAQQIGWVSEYGHRLSFNEQGIATCEESGEMYKIIKNSVNKL